MDRRSFAKKSLLGSLAAYAKLWPWSEGKSHILSLSFDDGFETSFLKIADIYENYGLKACLNVIASGHLKRFKQVDDWILPELMGDFEVWNQLVRRGHEVMPHSWKHLNLARQSQGKAERLISKCLDYFEENLEGYDPSYAVFNFPFNSSNPELEAFTMNKVRAIRSRGRSAVNPIPSSAGPVRLSCATNGPNNNDAWVETMVQGFLANPEGGWMVLNLHGLDKEGWGPISTGYLDKLLKKLVKIDYLEVMPVGEVLKRTRKT